MLAAIGIGMVVPLIWSLRIDGMGITRRRITGSDFWPWPDFGNGTIEKHRPYEFIDRLRPPWRRTLSLASLASSERRHAIELINQHYRLPDPSVAPDVLSIRYGFRRSATFDSKGIQLQDRDGPRQYLWAEVQRLHVTRYDPMRFDFKTLEISLPGRSVELSVVSRHGLSWRGATAEVVSEFLARRVPVDRIDIDLVGERPTKAIDVEKQLVKHDKKWRELNFCIVIFGPCLIGILVGMAIAENVAKALFMTFVSAIQVLPIWWLRRNCRAQRRELQVQLASFGSAKSERSP